MTRSRRASALSLALALAACARPVATTSEAAPRAASPMVVYLVRHAEKAAEPAGDPPLSAAGRTRAVALRESMRSSEVRTIVATNRLRTRETAAPLAAALGLVPLAVPVGDRSHVAAVAHEVRAHARDGAVLVVGHSNTVPAIVQALGGPRLPDLCDGEYATLFLLVADDTLGTNARLVRAYYGAPDDSIARCAATQPGR